MANRRLMVVASLLVIVAMVALTGCGGTPTPAPTAVPPTKAPAAPTTAPVAPTAAPAAPTAAPTAVPTKPAVPTAAPTAAPVNFPTRPITLLTTHAAGSGIDIAARVIAPYFSKYLGQPVVVENRDGAGGRAARAELVKAKADGYTLLVNGFPSTQLGELVYDGAYKTGDFSFIYNFLGGGDYGALYVAANSPYKTYADLVAASKTKAVKVTIPGMGSSAHLSAVYLRQKAGLNSTVIQYPAAQTILAVTSGDVPCGVDTLSGLTNQQGIRVLVLTSDSGRSPLMPDVPTTKELGFPGIEVPYRIGIVGPPAIPADIAKVLENAMAKAVADPAFQADMKKGGMGVEAQDAATFKSSNVAILTGLQGVVADIKKDMQ